MGDIAELVGHGACRIFGLGAHVHERTIGRSD
jgi:hypothetical protein